MTKELVTSADIPSHKLTVKTEDGRFKVFYCTEKQATIIRNGINGADKFLCLPKDIDKDAPTFYPKYGACLEKISKEELESRKKRYDTTVSKVNEQEQEKAKKFESAKVDEWITANPEGWKISLKAAAEKLSSTPIFKSASEVVQSVLVRMEARRNVHDQIIKPTP